MIAYLKEPATVRKLIAYVIEPMKSWATERQQQKLPFIACEVQHRHTDCSIMLISIAALVFVHSCIDRWLDLCPALHAVLSTVKHHSSIFHFQFTADHPTELQKHCCYRCSAARLTPSLIQLSAIVKFCPTSSQYCSRASPWTAQGQATLLECWQACSPNAAAL